MLFPFPRLTAAESFIDLILNLLALEFVIYIDELFFESFFPRDFQVVVKSSVFAWDRLPRTMEDEIKVKTMEFYQCIVDCVDVDLGRLPLGSVVLDL